MENNHMIDIKPWNITFICGKSINFACKQSDVDNYRTLIVKTKNDTALTKAWNDIQVFIKGVGYKPLQELLNPDEYKKISSLVSSIDIDEYEARSILDEDEINKSNLNIFDQIGLALRGKITKPNLDTTLQSKMSIPCTCTCKEIMTGAYSKITTKDPTDWIMGEFDENFGNKGNNNVNKKSTSEKKNVLKQLNQNGHTKEELECQNESNISTNNIEVKKIEAKVEDKKNNKMSLNGLKKVESEIQDKQKISVNKNELKIVEPIIQSKSALAVKEKSSKVTEPNTNLKKDVKLENADNTKIKETKKKDKKTVNEKKEVMNVKESKKVAKIQEVKQDRKKENKKKDKGTEDKKKVEKPEKENNEFYNKASKKKKKNKQKQNNVDTEIKEDIQRDEEIATGNENVDEISDLENEQIEMSAFFKVSIQKTANKAEERKILKEKSKQLKKQQFQETKNATKKNSKNNHEVESIHFSDKKLDNAVFVKPDINKIPSLMDIKINSMAIKNNLQNLNNFAKTSYNLNDRVEGDTIKLISNLKMVNACIGKACDFAMKGQLMLVVKCFDRAIELEPNNFGHYLNRSYCYLRLNLLNAAIHDAHIVLKESHNVLHKAMAKFILGKIHWANETPASAEREFEESLILNPENKIVLRELMYMKMNLLVSMGFATKSVIEVLYNTNSILEAFNILTMEIHDKNKIEKPVIPFQEDDIYFSDDEEDNNINLLTNLTNYQYEKRKQSKIENPPKKELTPVINTPKSKLNPVQMVKDTPVNKTAINIKTPNINFNDYDNKTLWVGSLTPAITNMMIKKKFERYGKIASVIRPTSDAWAFVNFEKPIALKDALETNTNCVINDVKVVVRPKGKK